MGGKAFAAELSAAAFPRMPTPIYNALKARLKPVLESFYKHVIVPHEMPEKHDHGDLDFLVATPKFDTPVAAPPLAPGPSAESSSSSCSPRLTQEKLKAARQRQKQEASKLTLPHDEIQKALGATHVKPVTGNATSNFAIPFARGEWEQFGYEAEEQKYRRETKDGNIYFQVDVQVCADVGEWERIFFCHSYGDTGMILGTIACMMGLRLGPHGLTYPIQPLPALALSGSFREILPFMGLPMDKWTDGFRTKQEIYDWIGSSKFFDPRKFAPSPAAETKNKDETTDGVPARKLKMDRAMFNEFVRWAAQQPRRYKDGNSKMKKEEIREYALKYFGKKEEVDDILRENARRKMLREGFNGNKVAQWAALDKPATPGKIMNVVRKQLGGDEGIINLLEKDGEEKLRELVLEVKRDVMANSPSPSPPPGGEISSNQSASVLERTEKPLQVVA